jgi:inorganic phosphate transporter, PiT family
LLAATFNIVGGCMGTAVAKTVGAGIVHKSVVTNTLVLSALIGAISWGLLTWWWGLPSSSSHALVGGLVGAAFSAGGWETVVDEGVQKTLLMLLLSPLMGFCIAWFFMMLPRVFARSYLRSIDPASPAFNEGKKRRSESWFRRLQLGSASFMALSHGSNDAQKTMGIVTMALMAYAAANGAVQTTAQDKFPIDMGVVLACALVMGLGTWAGGTRIIHTVGKLNDLTPAKGMASEGTAGIVIIFAAILGIPVSTTHVICSSIMGSGSSGVSRSIALKMIGAWIFTIPACAAISAACFQIFTRL